tara:strand:+ start:1310 stop:1609 length:300 start_codon:yes stop_codon:yes gene_type:complete
MKYDHEAIIKAYENTWGSIEDDSGVFDKDGNPLEIDQTLVDAARVELNKLTYQTDRKPLYPSLEDFADAMYWNSKGDSSKLTAYYAACEKVKTDNPKPS